MMTMKKSHDMVQTSNIFDQHITEGTVEENSPNNNKGESEVNYAARNSYKFSGSFSKSSYNNVAKPPTFKKKS